MSYKIFYDELIGMTHIAKHNVSIEEIDEILTGNYLLATRKDGSNVGYMKIASGRILAVVFRKISSSDFFIITAFDIDDKFLRQEIEEYENED